MKDDDREVLEELKRIRVAVERMATPRTNWRQLGILLCVVIGTFIVLMIVTRLTRVD